MEDQETQIDPNYIKGFNNGYILAKEEPELFEQIMKTPNEDKEYFKGLKAGGKEFIKEKFKDQLQKDREELKLNKGNDKEREKDL